MAKLTKPSLPWYWHNVLKHILKMLSLINSLIWFKSSSIWLKQIRSWAKQRQLGLNFPFSFLQHYNSKIHVLSFSQSIAHVPSHLFHLTLVEHKVDTRWTNITLKLARSYTYWSNMYICILCFYISFSSLNSPFKKL